MMKKPLNQTFLAETTRSSSSTSRPVFSKKDFRESPLVEQLYKTIYEHKLRESAYKTAIEIYLSRKDE